jgi:hypothetical protein
MFSRVLIVLITIFSIAWIGFSTYQLALSENKLTPEIIFNSSDEKVLIVNNKGEFDLSKIDLEIQHELKETFITLLQDKSNNNRIYISSNRPILLIESKHLLTQKYVELYLKELSIQHSENIELSVKNNYFLIRRKSVPLNTTALSLPNWDKKSTASILHLNDPRRVSDVYFKNDGIIQYKSKTTAEILSKKVDDQTLFADLVSSRIKSYQFYEREFAKQREVIDANSPLYKWTEFGFLLVDYNNTLCLISDYIGGQDPIAYLKELTHSEDEIGNHFKGIQLTKDFPSVSSKGFYGMYLGDKVVFSESKESCEKMVADYQLGNTLALKSGMKEQLYARLPQWVHERHFSSKSSYSKSVYNNLLVQTFIQAYTENFAEQVEEPEVETTWTTSLNGEILQIFGRGAEQIVLTSLNELFVYKNGKKALVHQLPEKVIGEIKWIEMNGVRYISFNTINTLYLLDASGKSVNGFPVEIKPMATNAIKHFVWKGVSKFVYMNTSQELVVLNANGKQLKSIKTSLKNVSQAIEVFVQNSNPIAVLTDDQKSITVNLESYKILKTRSALPENALVIKGSNGPNFYHISDGNLWSTDYTGQKVSLRKQAVPDLFALCESKNANYLMYSKNQELVLLNERGIMLSKIALPFSKVASFDVIQLSNGRIYILAVDALQNDVHVFDKNGNPLLEKPLEGKGKAVFSEKNGKLNIHVSANGFLVTYLDVLVEN